MSLIYKDNDLAYRLYMKLLDNLDENDTKSISLIVVQHFVPNVIPFVEALACKFKHIFVLPKPNSINPTVLQQFENGRDSNITVLHAKREKTSDYKYFELNVVPKLDGARFIIIDIGGYFAFSHQDIYGKLGGGLIGVVEDTENGHQKYLEAIQITHGEPSKPVFSVARSPLKDPEDHLVGESIVYAIERILRDNNSLLTNKRCLVIGYGKIGKSVASSLAAKNVSVWVFDKDPIRRAQALSHGYYTPEREYALKRVDLIVSATGQKSLCYTGDSKTCDFEKLKDGCFIASVTSADDEFDFGEIRKDLSNQDNQNNIETFRRMDDRVFHVLSKGNAVNFTHNNALGPYIYMVSCEIIGCMRKLMESHTDERLLGAIQELAADDRREVAEEWISAFLEDRRVEQ